MKKLQSRSRIMIVDDHPMMRDGLSLRISSQPDMEVCGEAATEDEAVTLVKQLSPRANAYYSKGIPSTFAR